MIIIVAKSEAQARPLRPILESRVCRIIVPSNNSVFGWSAKTIIVLPGVDLDAPGNDGMPLEAHLRAKQASFENPNFITLGG